MRRLIAVTLLLPGIWMFATTSRADDDDDDDDRRRVRRGAPPSEWLEDRPYGWWHGRDVWDGHIHRGRKYDDEEYRKWVEEGRKREREAYKEWRKKQRERDEDREKWFEEERKREREAYYEWRKKQREWEEEREEWLEKHPEYRHRRGDPHYGPPLGHDPRLRRGQIRIEW